MDSIEKRIQRLREQLGGGGTVGILTVIFKDGSRQQMDLADCFYFVLDHPDAVARVECAWRCGNLLDIIYGLIPSSDEAKPDSGKGPK